jgi:hypothetical protein
MCTQVPEVGVSKFKCCTSYRQLPALRTVRKLYTIMSPVGLGKKTHCAGETSDNVAVSQTPHNIN